MTISPAYGRDYASKEKALLDFNKGLDFFAEGYGGSGYCSIRDLEGQEVSIRYKKKTMQVIVRVKDGKAS